MSLIERQAATDAVKGLPTWWADEGGYYGGAQPPMKALLDPEDVVSAIENLPSAQAEIIRCKDCEHGMYDFMCHFYWCHGAAHSANWFCADEERRTDD